MLFACLLLGSCAAPRQLPTLPPGKLYKGDYVNVRAPNSEGWVLADSSIKGMAFAKRGLAAGETMGAQLLMFDLPPSETPEQFLSLIREGMEKDTDRNRFDVLQSVSEYTADRPYPCVRHRGSFNDKQAVTSPTTKERLLLEAHGLYCRHPVRTNTGFAAIYSYRGRSAYPRLAEEARDFIQGVQVP
jgi:hypothetical protein